MQLCYRLRIHFCIISYTHNEDGTLQSRFEEKYHNILSEF